MADQTGTKQSVGVFLQGAAEKWAPAFRMTILLMISILAVIVRVFSVIRFESVIHEFDPWFNYRTSKYLAKEGLYGLWNWFDSESWYPLGRSVGGTVYPGLMTTAGIIYWGLHALSIPVDIRNVCVFLAPIFAAFTAIAAFLLTKEITRRSEAGLIAAFFVAIVPSYMSRSVAGSYDNEAVAIFALVFTFYVFMKAVNTGSLLWGNFAALALFYMVSAWGGYAFIVNIIPIFIVAMFFKKFLRPADDDDLVLRRIYVAYSAFYVIGTFYAMQIPFVGFQAIHSSEHMASHGVFIFLQVYMFISWVRSFITKSAFRMLSRLFILTLVSLLVLGFLFLTFTGKTQWSGRSLTLLDPTYAKKYIPIIASVSEHQATTWSSFFFDLHYLIIFTPVGLYYCLRKPTAAKLFASLYVVLSVYFASVMVRLLLVLAPAVSVMAGIGVSYLFRKFTQAIRSSFEKPAKDKQGRQTTQKKRIPPELAAIGLIFVVYMCSTYAFHATNAGAESYSHPSIILASRDRNGNRFIIDDFRESYYWLRQNTAQDAKIMSWWDYGYQITGMSNRTVLVDNNTWNNTHIATVGMAMSSSEEDAYEICEKLDVDYVLVIFGGFSYYSGDDINKFLWMVRIGGGVFPHIKEEDYYGRGQYRIDQHATPTMLNCLMYKLCYYRFDEVKTDYWKPPGYDTVRGTEIGHKGFKLKRFEEAFTSERWIVRIYKVKPRENRDGLSIRSRSVVSMPEKLSEATLGGPTFKYHKYAHKLTAKRRRAL
eukprot:TRINITY_DN11755_c0_g1_i1.p1 TRINITY_DN11755_c0_g1~~TRINITY_DN11755_c0_g1_i1.p1  ORF type:complete len:762 (+),score=212.95 TRINITY_DN11755_c0_g1_i1:119-2404(+)